MMGRWVDGLVGRYVGRWLDRWVGGRKLVRYVEGS